MNEREEANRFECCERCGEPPALCGCWSTNNDLVGRLRSELSALRQQLAEKEQDFQVVKLAVIETEGRCAEFKAMLDDTLKQEFAVRQQLAEARADRDNFQCQLKAFDKLHWELVDLFDKDARGVSPLHYVKERIAAQAAELARLRERCEAATFVRYGNVSFQKSLMSGKWIVFRDHHEVTEYLAGDGRESFGNAYADTIDAGWLRDSNNKGRGYRESALTPQQEPGK